MSAQFSPRSVCNQDFLSLFCIASVKGIKKTDIENKLKEILTILLLILTPNSMIRASIILPMTVMKSNVFHGSLKKFWKHK